MLVIDVHIFLSLAYYNVIKQIMSLLLFPRSICHYKKNLLFLLLSEHFNLGYALC